MFARPARWIVRLRWAVVAFWAVATLAAVVLGPSPPALKGIDVTSLVPEDSPAIQATAEEIRLFGIPLVGQATGVIRDADGFSAAQIRAFYTGAASATADRGFDPVLIAAPVVNAPQWTGVSTGVPNSTALVYLTMRPDTSVRRQVDSGQRLVRDLAPPGAYAGVTGAAPAELEQGDAIAGALGWMTLITLLLVLLVIAAWFRAVPAPVIMLAAAGVAYLCATHTSAFLATHGVPFPGEAEPLVVALVLGVTVDYAVFLVHGTRRRMAAGTGSHAAVTETLADHAPIIAAAAITVAAGACALFAADLDFLRDLAPALAVAALVSALVALTLVPAVAAILGDRLFWPRRPTDHQRPSRAARLIETRRRAALTLGGTLVVLGIAAAGVLWMRPDVGLITGLPSGSEPRVAAAQASRGFAEGAVAPSIVLVQDDGLARERGALGRLETLIGRQPGVAAVLGPVQIPSGTPKGLLVATTGDAARYVVVLSGNPLGPDAVDDVTALEARLPALLREAGLPEAQGSVGGYTALADATIQAVRSDLVRVGLVLILVSLVLMGLFLRSVIAPVVLVAGSAVALVSALGLATWIVQGIASDEGFPYYVPLAATVLLVSLGADYAVFFAGRIWQGTRTESLPVAIRHALERESDALGAAGTALALSFAALAVIPVTSFRVLGLVMALGVLLDTFVIRPLLFPAALLLIGRACGWPGSRLAPPEAEAGPTAPR